MTEGRGLGKCKENHSASYGYATRPEDRYPYCSQCGNAVVWACPKCSAALPEDSAELMVAQFCRQCGSAYFAEQ